MYHQLGKISGRLVASASLQSPLLPIAPIALQRVEPPSIQYNTAHMSSVSEACPAPGPKKLIPGTNVPYAPLNEKLKQRQQLFQKENDVPVFLKGGPFDAVLYRLTMFLCVVGLVGIGHTVYIHAVPKQ